MTGGWHEAKKLVKKVTYHQITWRNWSQSKQSRKFFKLLLRILFFFSAFLFLFLCIFNIYVPVPLPFLYFGYHFLFSPSFEFWVKPGSRRASRLAWFLAFILNIYICFFFVHFLFAFKWLSLVIIIVLSMTNSFFWLWYGGVCACSRLCAREFVYPMREWERYIRIFDINVLCIQMRCALRLVE